MLGCTWYAHTVLYMHVHGMIVHATDMDMDLDMEMDMDMDMDMACTCM